jgi:subtilisin family serine protease
MVGDHIIVKLPENSTQQKAQEMASKIGARASAQPFAPNTWLFQLDRTLEAVPKGMEGLQSSGAKIEYTEPDLIVRPARLPNDPKVTDFTSWHLYNNTQIDQDIKAARAWDRRTSATYGSTNKVIVAVIDGGVRYTHEDLAANMWRNPRETAGDGIDNDGNGWIDDIYGIDAYGTEDWNDRDDDAKKDTNLFESGFTDANGNLRWDTDTNPMDEDGHGTQCAGLIGAVGNNGVGIVGVAWAGIEMMALRFIGNDIGSVSDEVLCMDYARLHGVKIINASFGQNGGSSSTEIDAITRLNSSGVILVAAAGNGGDDQVGDNNNGANPWYPASYTNANIITVGATDRNDSKPNFSNYGATAVDLFAPGASIYSTFATSDTSYVTASGTSFAAPLVVGALALLVAEYPNDTVSQRVARLVNTNAVDVVPALSGLCVTGGRLNLAKLLPAADVSTLPSALAWHRPNYREPLISSSMRTPTPVLLSNNVTIFSGLKKFNNTDGVNTYGLANQTGGWLFYRTSATDDWSSSALSFHANSGDYQFWKATLPSVSARTYEYYLQLDFDSGARTTFLHYSNSADEFATTTTQTTAQSSPYSFTVPKTAASITLGGLNQTYNGSAQPVSITTSPPGLSYTVTYNGTSSAPTNAGTYTVVATITDPNYEGSTTGTLTISKASATISLSDLNQTYDGTARVVTTTTAPSGLVTSFTYNDNPSAPINAGSFSVVATIIDSNYQGSVTDTLTVAKASATVTLGNTSQIYDGSNRSVLTTTTPPGLSTSTTYDGSSTAPVNAGSYVVVTTVTDPNYEGSTTSTLTVAKAYTSVSIAPTASSIRFGQSLADSSLNGGVGSVPGNFSFADPMITPALGTSSYTVKFTPDESSNYLDALTNASVTVGGILNPSQDSDGDGIPNLLEHALASFSAPHSNSSPLGQITTQSLDGATGPETILSLDVTVRIDDPAVTIEPEASLDLASDTNWITNGFTIHIPDQTNVPPGFQLRQYRFHAGTNPCAFMRLNVQQQ